MRLIEITSDIRNPLGPDEVQERVRAELKRKDLECVLVKRSIDCRKSPLYRYQVEVYDPSESYTPYSVAQYQDVHNSEPVIVVGAGPAGMFAALKLLTLGFKPIVLERGKNVHDRKYDMAALSRTGVVDPDSNYCFGEGGAGAFSDGKLYTRSSKRGDNREVLYQLVQFGAKPDILFEAHPHIGSDKLPFIVENIRKCITDHGGEYHFGARVMDIETLPAGLKKISCSNGEVYEAKAIILATGHSARDIYEMLLDKGCNLEQKGFALGVRAEHPQSIINKAQYRGHWVPGMPAAEYSFVQQVEDRGVFSFCMCPGGILVPSATEPETVVMNGMSNSSRNSRWANAGIVVQIEPSDVKCSSGPLGLLDYQRQVERLCFQAGARLGSESPANPAAAPAQRMADFCNHRLSKTLPETSYHPGTYSADLHSILPSCVAGRLAKAFPAVRIPGYYTNDSLLLGVESRTSSPVRIPRNPETLEYESLPGVFPCGEGAGYSGGIVSSAIDGIRCAVAAAALVGEGA